MIFLLLRRNAPQDDLRYVAAVWNQGCLGGRDESRTGGNAGSGQVEEMKE